MLRSLRIALAIGIVVTGSPWGIIAQQEPPTPTALVRQTVTFVDVKFTKDGKPWDSRGTGFFVYYPDERLGENQGFVYLVTNRHVAQPEIEEGQAFPVTSTHIRLNLRKKENGQLSEDAPLPSSAHWHFPTDESIDLAAMAILPNIDKYEYVSFPISS